MRKLFFDIQITGHHSEYISHLVNCLHINNDVSDDFFFVTHPKFSDQFPDIVFKAKQLRNVFWIEIAVEELKKSQEGGLVKSSFSVYKLMDTYAKRYKIDHVYLLYFNTFQLPCIFYRSDYLISGILFLQFYRMNKSKLMDKVKYYRKYLITKLYTLNNQIEDVFILNDQKTVDYFNNEFKTCKFKILADPIPELNPLSDFDIYKHYNINRGCKIFLHIGSLGDRKGTFEVIEAAKSIPVNLQSKIAILLVGKANEKESPLISLKIKQISNESNVTVIWDRQFVSNEFMKSLFDQCFAVLIPYKNTETSSGILGHAASSNKPVIVTKKGLLLEMVFYNKLGVFIDYVCAILIAKAIVKIDSFIINKDLSNAFVKEHQPLTFVNKLLRRN